MSKKEKEKNKSKKYSENDKVSMAPNLEIERKHAKEEISNEHNFVPSLDQWTSSDEQKVKARELSSATSKGKNKKK